jgi:hypothetical protein
MVNVTKILDLIAAHPGIRTMQLCDKLDCEIDELDAWLKAESEMELTIVAHNILAPNGRRATAYTRVGVPLPVSLTPAPAKELTIVERAIAFIQAQPDKQATGAQLHNALELKETDAPSVRLAAGLEDGRLVKEGKYWTVGRTVPAQADVQENSSVCEIALVGNSAGQALMPEPAASAKERGGTLRPQPAKMKPPPGKTKIQTVIDYLREHGKSDTEALRGVLGIRGKSPHPLSYLQDALSDRRIARSGNSWWVPGYEQVKFPPVDPEIPSFVPQATPVVAEIPPIVAESEPSATEIMPPVADVKPEVQTTILDDDGHLNMPRQLVTEARKLLEQERKASEFACALWSDGELQLVRSGNTVATLTPEEALHLSKYLKRTALEVA